jgi:zinc transporter ZupT
MGVTLSLGILYAVSGWLRKRQKAAAASGLVLAYSIAFGIGIHNLGEGLAIGGAYSLGEFAAGTMLVLGFTLHNLTEGVAVVAPVVQSRFKWLHLLWLGALAGLPTIAGTLLGAFAYSATWAVLFLAIGAGAVFQVVIEIVRYQIRERGTASLAEGLNLAGFAAGMAVMYLTGLFVTV